MRSEKRRFKFLWLGNMLALTCLLAGGCDFSRVDEGASTSLADHLQALNTADTQAEAEDALGLLLNKAEVGVPHRVSLYSRYEIDGELRTKLAREQAGFVAGDRSMGSTLDALMTIARKGGLTIDIPKEDFIAVFNQEVAIARQAPEAPSSAVLLGAVASGSLEGEIQLTGDHLFSPVQSLLFVIWLGVHGPNLDQYASVVAAGKTSTQSNEGKIVICHKPTTPAENTLEVAISSWPAHQQHGDRLGACDATPFESCTEGCRLQYLLCLLECRNGDECVSRCELERSQCVDGCHNQGHTQGAGS